MHNHRSSFLVALVGAVVLVACGIGVSELASSADSTPAPLSERTQGLAAAPWSKLKVGEECTTFSDRNGACASGLCLTVSPGFPPRGICSISCKPGVDDACPDGWACLQAHPLFWVCAPPTNHVSGEATLHGKPMPLPPPLPAAAVAAPGRAPDAGAAGN